MKPFSAELQDWLGSKQSKTVKSLVDLAADRSFALVFLILMAIPALPLPTGGISNIFEIIAILTALQMAWGRKTIWLPKKWLSRPLNKIIEQRAMPKLISVIRWLEKYSRPRFSDWLNRPSSQRLIGVLVVLFATASFVAPPFSGLDTLPAMAVVAISLALLLEDVVLVIVGLVLGVIGLGLEFTLSQLFLQALRRY